MKGRNIQQIGALRGIGLEIACRQAGSKPGIFDDQRAVLGGTALPVDAGKLIGIRAYPDAQVLVLVGLASFGRIEVELPAGDRP